VRGDASVGKTLTLDKARRIAANIAELPGVTEETLIVTVYRTLKPIMCRPT
jgi:hypothetical protein